MLATPQHWGWDRAVPTTSSPSTALIIEVSPQSQPCGTKHTPPGAAQVTCGNRGPQECHISPRVPTPQRDPQSRPLTTELEAEREEDVPPLTQLTQ